MQWYSEIINQEMKRQELLKCSESAILVFLDFFLKNSAFLKMKKMIACITAGINC